MFFVSIAITSDVVCYLFIPIQWLFFAASTYVWVQYVWHTGRFLFVALTAKKQTTKFTSSKFKKSFQKVISYWELKDLKANSVDPDEAAHYELPHQDLCC